MSRVSNGDKLRHVFCRKVWESLRYGLRSRAGQTAAAFALRWPLPRSILVIRSFPLPCCRAIPAPAAQCLWGNLPGNRYPAPSAVLGGLESFARALPLLPCGLAGFDTGRVHAVVSYQTEKTSQAPTLLLTDRIFALGFDWGRFDYSGGVLSRG